jgi:hypothetical protein
MAASATAPASQTRTSEKTGRGDKAGQNGFWIALAAPGMIWLVLFAYIWTMF